VRAVTSRALGLVGASTKALPRWVIVNGAIRLVLALADAGLAAAELALHDLFGSHRE